MASDVRFTEVRALLERHGWTLIRVAGSHHIFTKPNDRMWSVPVHGGKVKAAYVRQIKKYLDED